MTEQVQAATFDIHLQATADGRIMCRASGNLNPPLIYAQLGVLMRKLEEQMQNPAVPILGSRAPEFKIRRLP